MCQLALRRVGRPRDAAMALSEGWGRSRKERGTRCDGGGGSPAVLNGQQPHTTGEPITENGEHKRGKKIEERDALQMSKNAIDKGAVGVDMGRNIFQSDSPLGMIKAVRAIVHDNVTVDEAYEIYKQSPKGL